MNTIQYIIRVIKRFGLFGQIDVSGLVQEIIDYQVELVKNSGVREYNTELMSRINQSISVRKTLNTTLDKWVTDLTSNPEFTEVDVADSAYDPTRLPGLVIASDAKTVDLPFPTTAVTVEVLPPTTPEIIVSDATMDAYTTALAKAFIDNIEISPTDITTDTEKELSKPKKVRAPRKPRKPKKGK